MKTDFNYPNSNLLGPVVFRPEFNNFEKINANQAWSLFFTAGQEDKVLGQSVELGRFFTNLLVAFAVTGGIWGVVFNHVV
ncbi:hypothetical protein [Calothrix sp. 336/3]|uniref:hypothetical protein n=1 Tax=Calothrix sp. 336/3 TaxID=1337936 RepID=UPI0004E3F02A|nr:hypothetical protein [Calothrix sp. 336/3]AKG23377.1 hypothetical protein IJ00_20705 [Calothrix sp. 336/3]